MRGGDDEASAVSSASLPCMRNSQAGGKNPQHLQPTSQVKPVLRVKGGSGHVLPAMLF